MRLVDKQAALGLDSEFGEPSYAQDDRPGLYAGGLYLRVRPGRTGSEQWLFSPRPRSSRSSISSRIPRAAPIARPSAMPRLQAGGPIPAPSTISSPRGEL